MKYMIGTSPFEVAPLQTQRESGGQDQGSRIVDSSYGTNREKLAKVLQSEASATVTESVSNRGAV